MVGLLTGSGWREDGFNLEFRLNREKSLISISLEDQISFELGQRQCIGYRAPGMDSLQPCPDNIIDINTSQCPQCFTKAMLLPCLRCTGERCNNPARRKDCVKPYNHALYLASFAPGIIKVGVARWHRRLERLSEQGAKAAIVIARDDGQIIRRSETQIKNFGLYDRILTSKKLQYLQQQTDSDQLYKELFEVQEKLKRRMRANWLEDPEIIDLPEIKIPDNTQPRLKKFFPGSTLRGRVVAIVGQGLIIETDNRETIAIEPKTLTGYNFLFLKDKQGTDGQLSLINDR
jgi:hypothetical protein